MDNCGIFRRHTTTKPSNDGLSQYGRLPSRVSGPSRFPPEVQTRFHAQFGRLPRANPWDDVRFDDVGGLLNNDAGNDDENRDESGGGSGSTNGTRGRQR